MLLLGGFAGSCLIAWLAYRRGSLDAGAVVAAVAVGTIITAGGGWPWAALLLLFFLSSTALSHAGARRKQRLSDLWAKGKRRDRWQVLANGGLAAALAAVYGVARAPVLALAYAGALAAVTADTWATELGVLGGPPRMLTTGRHAPVGASGAISLLGTLAAAGGALIIGVAAGLLARAGALPPEAGATAIVFLAGFAGAFADSLLGATLQASYRCPRCATLTEKTRHGCGTATELVSGIPWIDNDVVNFLASCIGAAAAAWGALGAGR